MKSGFSGRPEIQRDLWLIIILDRAVCLLKSLNIFAQGIQEFLGMLGGKYDPTLYFTLWPSGHHTDKIHHELRNGMVDDGEVGIGAFRGLLIQLNIDLLGVLRLFFLFSHSVGIKNP